MAGIISTSGNLDSNMYFTNEVRKEVSWMFSTLDFVINHKVYCMNENRKSYIYIEIIVNQSEYTMHILATSEDLETMVRNRITDEKIPLRFKITYNDL